MQVVKIGKPLWQPLLSHAIDLHVGGVHAPFGGLPYRWGEVAPGGELGQFYGGWDTVHTALDLLNFDPKHGLYQILNILALQQPDGFVPGHLVIKNNELVWNSKITSPPLWPILVQDYIALTGDRSSLETCYHAVKKQIDWFETYRQQGEGYYYLDCLDAFWESGVEESIRYIGCDIHDEKEIACIDATSHVYNLYTHAITWAEMLNEDAAQWQLKADKLRHYIQNELFDSQTGYFYDRWAVKRPEQQKLTFEGLWPFIVGAISSEQAQNVINQYCLEPSCFFTHHPIPSIGIRDPHFAFNFWRGPARNSIAYWVARGCITYGRIDAAKILLERALDATTEQFQNTGKIWEFYPPQGGDPRELSRQYGSFLKHPCSNYLGHNPLIAMAQLWEKIRR